MVATCLSLSVVDRVGRRPALIFGATSMMISIALLGVFSTLEEKNKEVVQPEPCSDYFSSFHVTPSFEPPSEFQYSSGMKPVSPDLPLGRPPAMQVTSPFPDSAISPVRTTKYPMLPTPIPLRLAMPRNITFDNQKRAESITEDASCTSNGLSFGLRYIAMLSLMCYVAAYAFGFGPVTWLVLTEIFPTAVRGRAMAAATSLNWMANLIISVTFLQFVGE